MSRISHITPLVFALILPAFTACGPGQDRSVDESVGSVAEKDEDDTSTVNLTDEQVKRILKEYLEIKDALIRTDGAAANDAVINLVAVVAEDAEGLAGEIRSDARAIADAEDIEGQRKRFYALSENLYSLIETGVSTRTLYRQYCPMAMDNQGAYWLSDNEEIRNPYFGSKMLKCGRITETIN